MAEKQQILNELTEIFNRWQDLLASQSEKQIIQPFLASNWSIKDVIAHLLSWQQASIARMNAALHSKEPDYPEWWKKYSPNPEEDVDRTNAWLYTANKDKSWSDVYADWRAQFQHYLKLLSQISEKDLFEPGKYAWMDGYTLSASSMGTLEHHQEHYDTVCVWLRNHGKRKRAK